MHSRYRDRPSWSGDCAQRGGMVEHTTFQCGDFRIEPGNRRLSTADGEIALEPKAFAVLLQLVARAGELLTRDELLDAVWGHRYVTPATLTRVIALLRRAFGDDASAPRYFDTVHGAGYRYIGPLQHGAAAAAREPRARFEPPPRARLPAALGALVGRDEVLQRVGAQLAAHRAVTLLGAGGIGKTQCALELARRAQAAFPDGVWFFDLAACDAARDGLRSVAQALSIAADDDEDLSLRIAAQFAGRTALLLLDSCERLAGELGEIVVDLLQRCDGLKVLVTSQRRLNFIGEHVTVLQPLGLPDRRTDAALDAIAAAASVTLLVARAREVAPDFALTHANAGVIVAICHQLDGMPLALELAAARLAFLSPAELLGQLRQRFHFLAGEVAGRAARHQTLRALLEWNCGLLSRDEARLFSALGVFPHSWTAEGAIAVGAALDLDAEAVMGLLGALINTSLVVVEPDRFPTRYRLLETVRAFALERLPGSAAERNVRDAHLGHVVRLVQRSHEEILRPSEPYWSLRMAHEHAGIDAALDWALSARGRDDDAALRITGALMLYGKCHGEFRLVRGWCRRTLEQCADRVDAAGARTLLALGVSEFYLRAGRDVAILTEAAARAAAQGDAWAEAYASGYLACQQALAGQIDAARSSIGRIAGIAEALDDDLLRGLAGLATAFLRFAQGRLADAFATLMQARDLGSDWHQRHFIAMYVGLAAFGSGDPARAATLWNEAMARSIELRHLRGSAGAIEGAAYLAASRGEASTAAWLLGAAAAIRAQSAPLFGFWHPYHDEACHGARAALGEADYAREYSQGARTRFEVAVNLAHAWLRQREEPSG